MNAVRNAPAAALIVLALACARTDSPDPAPAGNGGQVVTQPVVDLACQPSANMPVEGRQSPYDSVTVSAADQAFRVCYGRPAAQGRQIFGGLVPYGSLWRTGANEATILHLPFEADIAGLRVPPGSYSLYTVPQESGEWELIINRSISQWGHPSSYTDEVRSQELGRATIRTERMDQSVELFTIRGESVQGGADLLLEWDRTRARVPVRVVAG
ncbi:MAG: DUF2911 domain-containing protein [Gemmatimonadetes bacterium]|nr:DUF2911 domain-containing protein [Gemmatimonadota bacterium]